MKPSLAIRRRVLRGIALNRTPGFHFPGNFLDVSFDHVSRRGARLSIDPGPWCVAADGQADLGTLAMLSDLALAACIRAHLAGATRLGTVSLSLQFTGRPRAGRLRASAQFEGFFDAGHGRLGMSRAAVTGAAGQVCHGAATFMVLEPPSGVTLHPVPLRSRRSPEPAPLAEGALHGGEREILRRADEALARGGNFIAEFWGCRPHRTPTGAACTMENGPHIDNRVGHAQGGILLALAAQTAAAALPANWRLSGVSAWYIRPGDGRALHAVTRVVHHGRQTAVLRTRVTGRNRRRVLEAVTTHCAAVA